jgi:tripartite-type tricarboxylate transporter receptor subunit TctC
VLIPDSFDLAGTVLPSAFDDYPGLSEYLPISQAIGFAIKADAPANVKKVLVNAFDEAMKSAPVLDFGDKNYYVLSGATGAKSKDVFNKLESTFAWTLWELGAAKVDPATLGIPKP